MVELVPDYPGYSLATLASRADLIVSAAVTGVESAPADPWFEGDSPERDPMAGMSETEQQAVAREGAVPATKVTLRVTKVYAGTTDPDYSTIEVWQTGGELDGVRYVDPQSPLMVAGGEYLVFLGGADTGVLYPLGGGRASTRMRTVSSAPPPSGSRRLRPSPTNRSPRPSRADSDRRWHAAH